MRRLSVSMRIILLVLITSVCLTMGARNNAIRPFENSKKQIVRIQPGIYHESMQHASRSTSVSSFAKAPLEITTCTWVGGGTGNWEVPTNWSCSQVPGPNNNVEILLGTVTLNSNADVKSLKIGSSGGLIVTTGRTIVVNEWRPAPPITLGRSHSYSPPEGGARTLFSRRMSSRPHVHHRRKFVDFCDKMGGISGNWGCIELISNSWIYRALNNFLQGS